MNEDVHFYNYKQWYLFRYQQQKLQQSAEAFRHADEYRQSHPNYNRTLAWIGHRLEEAGRYLVRVSQEPAPEHKSQPKSYA